MDALKYGVNKNDGENKGSGSSGGRGGDDGTPGPVNHHQELHNKKWKILSED